MTISNVKITEEKVKKLKPIFESILSRKHGKEIKLKKLTIGEITIMENKGKENL